MDKIKQVEKFWDQNPLWTGESRHKPGTKAFYDEHRQVYIDDCFAGYIDDAIFAADKTAKVLDLGCGVGFWLVEFSSRGYENVSGADLSQKSLDLAKKRCELFDADVALYKQNGEALTFKNGEFIHVNCLGVIHHSPSPENIVKEIERIITKNGTATISVYYKNIILRHWKWFLSFGRVLQKIGAKLSGRGRDKLYALADADEIVRLYDGEDNPIGIAYTKKEFLALMNKYFVVERVFYHFFPARSLPVKVPKFLHKFLNKRLPFMIVASLRKKEA